MKTLARPHSNDPTTSVSSNFRRFGPETEKAVRKAEVQASPILEEMRKRWEGMTFSESIDDRDKSYGECLDAIRGPGYCAKDVESFSLLLFEYRFDGAWTMKPGMFLSALINEGKENDYTVHTAGIEKLHFLGFRNRKHIVINGDGGINLAENMEKGRIEVNGSVGYECGRRMVGGSIIIEGDTGDYCGPQMIDGLIRVKGNVGHYCGHLKRKGAIIVHGNSGQYCGTGMEGGSIYVRGDAGHSCGFELNGGRILVGGNAGRWCGDRMIGGRVFVRGNTSTYCGQEMKGGILCIGGDADEMCGHEMEGGRILIGGSITGISSDIIGGTIFHKGVRIWPKEGGGA